MDSMSMMMSIKYGGQRTEHGHPRPFTKTFVFGSTRKLEDSIVKFLISKLLTLQGICDNEQLFGDSSGGIDIQLSKTNTV